MQMHQNNAAGFIRLKPYKERGDVKDASQLSNSMMQAVSSVKDANTFFFTFPTIQGFGNVSGFEFMLEDRGNHSLDDLRKNSLCFIGALMQRPEIAAAFTTFSVGNPQYEIEVDDEKTKQLGVNVSDLLQTLQVYYGSSFVSDFNRFGKYYRVMAQADIQYRADASSFNNIYVKNSRARWFL